MTGRQRALFGPCVGAAHGAQGLGDSRQESTFTTNLSSRRRARSRLGGARATYCLGRRQSRSQRSSGCAGRPGKHTAAADGVRTAVTLWRLVAPMCSFWTCSFSRASDACAFTMTCKPRRLWCSAFGIRSCREEGPTTGIPFSESESGRRPLGASIRRRPGSRYPRFSGGGPSKPQSSRLRRALARDRPPENGRAPCTRTLPISNLTPPPP